MANNAGRHRAMGNLAILRTEEKISPAGRRPRVLASLSASAGGNSRLASANRKQRRSKKKGLTAGRRDPWVFVLGAAKPRTGKGTVVTSPGSCLRRFKGELMAEKETRKPSIRASSAGGGEKGKKCSPKLWKVGKAPRGRHAPPCLELEAARVNNVMCLRSFGGLWGWAGTGRSGRKPKSRFQLAGAVCEGPSRLPDVSLGERAS